MNFLACDLGGTKVLLGIYKKDVNGDPIYYYTRVEGSDNIQDVAHALTVHPLNAEVLYQSKGRLDSLDDYSVNQCKADLYSPRLAFWETVN